jgi:DNA-binding LacI/PurR family transcriptional regulator
MKNTTIFDVAQKTGKSRQVVSSVLNNRDYIKVSEATREKILRIAREMDYRPNYFAKTLKTGKTNCIGIISGRAIADINQYYIYKVIEGIETSLGGNGRQYSHIMLGLGEDFFYEPAQTCELLERRLVDGLILIIVSNQLERFRKNFLPRLKKIGTPFVVVHSISGELPFNNVGFNSRAAAFMAVEHFFKLGYQRIGYYLRDSGNPQLMEMLAGFKEAFQRYGITWSDASVIASVAVKSGEQEYHSAYRTMLQVKEVPEALFVHEDSSAYGILKACQERGIRVPGDMALIGCDDQEQNKYSENELTTVHHSFEDKGQKAVRMLTGILNGELDRNTVHRQIVEPYLVFRRTCLPSP